MVIIFVVMTHNQLQQQCWMHLWNEYPQSRYSAWHTKNEAIPAKGESKKDYVIRRSQDKAVGLLPGVWDIVFYRKKVLHIFEIKVGNDKLSKEQLRFEKQTLDNGGRSYVISDLDMFKKIIKSILYGIPEERIRSH